MADSKITALTALTAADPANDMMPIVDVSDTSMAASGTTKRISINNILACSPSATLASLNVTGSSIPANGLYLPTTNTLEFSANSLAQYRIAPLGVFSWYDGAGGTRMTLNSTGLGVGVSPTSKVDIALSTSANAPRSRFLANSNDPAQEFQRWSGVASDYYGWRFSSDDGFYISSSSAAAIGSQTFTNRLTISSSGNVGISVTPSAWNSSYKAIQFGSGGAVSGHTSSSLPWFVASSNAFINSAGDWKYINNGYATRYLARGDDGTQTWWTSASGSAGGTITFTQAMTLDASGNLLVGTTSSLRNTAHSFKATGASTSYWAAAFQQGGTTSGGRCISLDLPNTNSSSSLFVYATNSSGYAFGVLGNGSLENATGSYGTISDLRLKENISDARNYLADLLKLRVVKYSLKSEASAVATKIGFIAQEVEQVFPTLVETNSDEVKSIKTTVLIPMLLKAIQELTARVQTLEAR